MNAPVCIVGGDPVTTRVYHDETAPKRARYRVAREQEGTPNRWITVEAFSTERDAKAFAQGFTLGTAYAPAPEPEPLDTCASRAIELLKLARDEYKRECYDLRQEIKSRS